MWITQLRFRLIYIWVCFSVVSPNLGSGNLAQGKADRQLAVRKTTEFIEEIVKSSYPEIKLKKIRVKTFESKTAFFKARFSIARYLTFQRMRHLVFVNPNVFLANAPEDGMRSIIAHELGHVKYYTEKNRIQLLGLSRLSSGGFTRKFERRADLDAISRGYGAGLIKYRVWLYKNIPQGSIEGKKRRYFSPEELKVILEVLREKPEMLDIWRKKVPRNIAEIKNSI